MEVVLLGTGAGGGWPEPFCWCASCQAQRANGDIRIPTAALVDDLVLLDGGLEALWAAARAGRSVAHLRAVLLTGGSPDPMAVAALVGRTKTRAGEPLTVAGPPGALAECGRLIRPDRSVQLVAARAGDRLSFGSHAVRVLGAAGGSEAVLFDVSGPAGDRLLYAGPGTSTGPLPQPTLDAVTGAAYDLALLELDVAAFPAPLLALRDRGAVVDRTDVRAVHLGHRNPPGQELARRLAAWGVGMARDGTVLRVGQAAPGRAHAHGHGAPRRVLVTGGARSGKSAEAERRLAAEPTVIYVATSGNRADDPEWAARIAAHQARRPPSWQTVETVDVAEVVAEAAEPVLVDCLTLWLAAVLDECGAWSGADEASVDRAVDDRVTALVAAWRAARVPVVAVTNEVGSGVVPATTAGRRFRDDLGKLNQRIAAESDEVVLMVAGLALPLRGGCGANADTPAPPYG
jgi:adenosylcobinamide kinase / adenosylcobinamide-phosphate guanylyltransferase